MASDRAGRRQRKPTTNEHKRLRLRRIAISNQRERPGKTTTAVSLATARPKRAARAAGSGPSFYFWPLGAMCNEERNTSS
jgi:hypothetical protein